MDLVEYFLERYKIKQKTYYNDLNCQYYVNSYVNKIYVINLASNRVRREYIKLIMKKLNINFTIIVVQKIHINVFRYLLSLAKTKMTRGEMGTYLSHMWCLKDAIKHNYKKFIILEDDIIFLKNFHEQFKQTVLHKNYDFLMLGASHFKIKDNDYLIKNNTYKPVFNVLKGNLLGAFAILYSNKMAKQMFLLRKKNIVFFDKNLYRIFKKNYATSAICYPNLIISDVSTTNLNHRFNIFKDGYYFKCYNTLCFQDYYFIYLDLFKKWCLNKKTFKTSKQAIIYLLCNYFNNNKEQVNFHYKRLDINLFSLNEINFLINEVKKNKIPQITYKNHKKINKILNITNGYLLNNRLEQFRYFCLDNLPLIKSFTINNFSPSSHLETVLIEYRKLPHMEFIIRNTILMLGNNWSHTVVCGETNKTWMKELCDSISKNIRVIVTNHNKMDRNIYSTMLTQKSFWEQFNGEKLLIYQEDSCIFHNNYQAFLKYDYIGAPWKQTKTSKQNELVGNGGFSLRTKKVMIDICKQFPIKNHKISKENNSYQKQFDFSLPPEDRYFSEVMIQQKIGNLASYDEAKNFSQESVKSDNSFGGHQFWLADPEWKKRLYHLKYFYLIKKKTQLTETQKNKVIQYPYLFHKVILNLVDVNKAITYDIKQKHQIKKKFLSHLHCYDISLFFQFYKSYFDIINEKTDIIITYCVGEINNDLKEKKVTVLKIKNKGMDIGGKFCMVDYLKTKKIDYSFILFLHSKTNNEIRKNWFDNIVLNLNMVNINDETIGGYFPECLFSGDNSNLLWFDKIETTKENFLNKLYKKNHYNELYFNEILKYLNLNENSPTCFSGGNCYVLKKRVAEKLFLNKIIYNILNFKTSFSYNWFKINYSLENNDILTLYEFKNQKNLCGNNLEYKTKNRTLPDCMIEHVFERLVFKVLEFFNLKLKFFTKKEKVKEFEFILNDLFLNKKVKRFLLDNI